MILLEETFISAAGGFGGEPLNYRQVIRSDKAAVYERSRDGIIKDFEAIKIRITPKGTIQKFPNNVTKVTVDDEENYATTSLWGKIGFSFKNKTAAINKFNELNSIQAVKDDADDEIETIHSNTTFIFPAGNFSTREFSDVNKILYPSASIFIKEQVESGVVKFMGTERRNLKGKPTNLYSKVS